MLGGGGSALYCLVRGFLRGALFVSLALGFLPVFGVYFLLCFLISFSYYLALYEDTGYYRASYEGEVGNHNAYKVDQGGGALPLDVFE